MKKIEFKFRFKGSRDYVHGTDMYNSLVRYLSNNGYSPIGTIDMAIHKIARTNLDGLIVEDSDDVSGYQQITSFVFEARGKRNKIILVENGEPVVERYPYPEETIIQLADIDKSSSSIALSRDIEFSNIEKVVALNKAIHESVYADVKGKWYFTRLQVESDIDTPKPKSIGLKILKNMNFQLTKSEVTFDDRRIGYIYFSLVR